MTVRADLDSLRTLLGAQSTADDAVLAMCLETAGAFVYDRVSSANIHRNETQHAVLLLASRLYKRRQSPEGVAGWEEMGVVRIVARDPDIERLLEQVLDVYKVYGIA